MDDFPILQTALAHEAQYWYDLLSERGDTKRAQMYLDQAKRRYANFLAAVKTAESALAAGEIPNVIYKDIKEEINRALESANHRVPGIDYGLYLHTVSGKLKKAAKEGLNDFAISYLKELQPVSEIMEKLKGMIVKRVAKAPEDVQSKYLAPRASDTAAAQVQKVLRELTEEAYQGIKQQLHDLFQKKIDKFAKVVADYKAKYKAEGANTRYAPPSPYDVFVRAANKQGYQGDRDGRDVCDRVFDQDGVLQKDAASTLDKMVTAEADAIRDGFVIKNLKKLDSILEAKGNFESVKVVGRSLSLGRLEGTLFVKFTDGSSFYAQNSVVWKQSTHGKLFCQFPLRFSEIKLPGGVRMPRPSEERMNTVFVGKAA